MINSSLFLTSTYITFFLEILLYSQYNIRQETNTYVPEIEVSELSNIILETIASLDEINPLTGRLIQIARDGKITDDEIKDFALISTRLDEISLAIDALNLWVDKTASENNLNMELLTLEKEKFKR